MATPAIMAKKAAKQTTEILAAVQSLATEVAELKAAKPDTIELTAEIDETADRTGEILAAISNAFGEIREQVDRNLSACAMIAAEVTGLKKQVAELAIIVDDGLSKPVQMPTRNKPKK